LKTAKLAGVSVSAVQRLKLIWQGLPLDAVSCAGHNKIPI